MLRSETYLINKQGWGDEPIYQAGHHITRSEQAFAYNWYAQMCDRDDAKQFLTSYLEAEGRTKDAQQINSTHKNAVPPTLGWIARIISNGAIVPPSTLEYFSAKLSNTLERTVEIENESIENTLILRDKKSVQENIEDKIAIFVESLFDRIYDGDFEFSMYDLLKANEIPAKLTPRIRKRIDEVLEEYQGALDGSCSQLVEAYNHYTKGELKEWVKFYTAICDDIDRYGSNTKKIARPRKKRVVTIDKKLKLFKYKVEDTSLKIASVNPAGLIGASEVWLFNCSLRVLTVLRAKDRGGLDVNRSGVTNYDPSTSLSKRCGRNLDKVLQEITSGGKIQLRRAMDGLSGQALEPSDRVTTNTIILRIIKS